MTLRRASILAAAGLCLSLGVRAVATLVPQWFLDRSTAALGAGLLLLGGLALVVFLVVFYRQAVGPEQIRLRHVTIVAILGSIAGLLPELQGLARILIALPGLRFARYDHISALAPWVAIFTILLFFVALRREARAAGRRALARASLSGIVGSAAFLVVASGAGLQLFLTSGGAHTPVVPPLLQSLAIPFIAVGFVATLYFFVSFTRHERPAS